MPLEAATKKVELGSLGSCLVEGNAEQRIREKKIRRWALAISVAFQAVLLAGVVIAPLLAKTPPAPPLSFVPVPPYRHSPAQRQMDHSVARQTERRRICVDCISLEVRPIVPNHHDRPIPDPFPGENLDIGTNPGQPTSGIDVFDPHARTQPRAPQQQGQSRVKKGGSVQAALLTHRVDPVYPALMQQIRRSGRVELHAIISTDGTIESLQVISGDPGFYQSALDAVRQWRYNPTFLNGQPVEVDTVITVIYNIG